jgi:hypothetical protein
MHMLNSVLYVVNFLLLVCIGIIREDPVLYTVCTILFVPFYFITPAHLKRAFIQTLVVLTIAVFTGITQPTLMTIWTVMSTAIIHGGGGCLRTLSTGYYIVAYTLYGPPTLPLVM